MIFKKAIWRTWNTYYSVSNLKILENWQKLDLGMLIFIVQNIDVENSFSTSKNAKILNVQGPPTLVVFFLILIF